MTKIEEVARAICCPSGCEWAPCLHDGDGEEPTAVRSVYLARAAIAALMEPSEGMIEAGFAADDVAYRTAGQGEHATPQAMFRAMLQAALDEGKEGTS